MPSQEHLKLPCPISRIFFRGCSPETQIELTATMPIHEGATLSHQLLQQVIDVAKKFDQCLEIRVHQVDSRDRLPLPPGDEAVSITIYDPASLWPQRIRIEGRQQDAMLVQKVMPKFARETGVVQLAVVVGKDGTVIDAKPLAGPDLLLDSALDTVRQWRYRPTLLNGFPVEVQTTVEVSFA